MLDPPDDDDTGDDDTGDDDTSGLPTTAGVWFEILTGPYAGSYEYTGAMTCDFFGQTTMLSASTDTQWEDGLDISLSGQPGPGEHLEVQAMAWYEDTPWVMFERPGGPHCFLDTVEGYPHVSGYFECADMEDTMLDEFVDISNGMVVCD